ncbi:hypothetical protein ANN_19806 [Periplaneta americana]|uniref:Ionotropic glutamate receptor C-terminal domain-containing protein n=1 Tax=Periplaneta americana TaxID=6978 RepID=A0ABQ8SBG8_PERAM|nr:hypothetical protein ANN_19806 [Periplaneta americana]
MAGLCESGNEPPGSLKATVSVPTMPNTWKLRMVVLLYVSYSFVITTVFQAFFTSFLVDPGYGKKMETLDEALKSDIKFAYSSAMGIAAMNMDYKEIQSFPSSRHLHCDDNQKCIDRMIYKRDIIAVAGDVYTEYLTSALGFESEKLLCRLNDNVISSSLVFLYFCYRKEAIT